MKILHASDILVGRDFREFPELAGEFRQARLDLLQTLVALAEKEAVDAVLLVGNTLADNRINHRTLLDVARLLGRSPAPVFILPGETDPLTPDSPYELRADVFQEPVQILRRAVPVEVKPGLTLFPCPVTARGGKSDLSWIPSRGVETGLRVGVALEGTSRELDYLATAGHPAEPVDFDLESGFAEVAELRPLSAHRVRVARFSWEQATLDIRSPRDVQHPGGKNVVLRLGLRGSIPESELEELQRQLQKLSSRCRHLSVRNEVSLEEAVGYRHPLLRKMAASLAAQAQRLDADPTELPETPEVAREALFLLRKLVGRSGLEDLA